MFKTIHQHTIKPESINLQYNFKVISVPEKKRKRKHQSNPAGPCLDEFQHNSG